MEYKKLIVNIQTNDMDKIQEACDLDKRTLSSLTRKVLIREANKILKEEAIQNA